MRRRDIIKKILHSLLLLAFVTGLSGCVHLPERATPAQMDALQAALLALSPTVQEKDARLAAAVAYDYPLELAAQYRLVRPPLWHNLLINLHLKKRGLCYQWAEDLASELQMRQLESLQLHWGVARPGSFWEHNTVVVTAPGQTFTNGIVLDPWRRSGRLVWVKVPADTYPWQEGMLNLVK